MAHLWQLKIARFGFRRILFRIEIHFSDLAHKLYLQIFVFKKYLKPRQVLPRSLLPKTSNLEIMIGEVPTRIKTKIDRIQ